MRLNVSQYAKKGEERQIRSSKGKGRALKQKEGKGRGFA